MSADFKVVVLDATDVDDVVAFLAANRSPGIRILDRAEVERLVFDGVFYAMLSGHDGSIVATTYFSERPAAAGGVVEYEMGGALVGAGLGGRGLMRCLGVCAIAAKCIESHSCFPRIVSHVECSNTAPIRHLLPAVGFVLNARKSIHAYSKQGMQHMPTDPNGNVCIDEYEFQQTHLCGCLRATEAYRDTGVLNVGLMQSVDVEIDILLAVLGNDALRDMIAQVCP